MKDFPYEDIVKLPHHQSKTRPHMPVIDRAAQFAPFAALTGHSEAVKETARLTEKQIELSEDEKAVLNGKLQYLNENIADAADVVITYFKPDDKKDGGAYIRVKGTVKKIREFERLVVMEGGAEIPIDNITGIDIGIF